MAGQQRSTTLAQESTRAITQVALYARVSTLNNQDPEMQLAELREYAGRRGWQIVEEFTDQGVSGWSQITTEMRIGKGTAQRALLGLPKIV
jgi:DNA invertase Pin-like site-specific DNA recombinase